MYALILRTDLELRTNAGLRDYARLEYGTPDAAWLVAAANRRPGGPRRRPSLTHRLRTALSARQPATGFPRFADECPVRA